MNIKYNKFLIVSFVLMLLGGIYLYSSHSVKTEAALFSSFSSSLSAEGEGVSSDQKIASDVSFISALSSLKKINIDISIFTNQSFKNLVDNTVKLDPAISGRPNPFSPVEVDSFGNIISLPVVTTDIPLEIKLNLVVFSGSVSSMTGVNSPYFEYGLTDKLGQKTASTTFSMIGSFISNVTALNKDATYFYRACAKINGENSCGDIISFKTLGV